jgi:hypothetical protein
MNTNHNKLALRKQSIRTLTADEMQIAHGGEGTNKTTTHTSSATGTACTTGTPTRTGKTATTATRTVA